MSGSTETLDKTILERALRWFQPEFRQQLVSPIESHFPGYPLPRDIQAVIQLTDQILKDIGGWRGDALSTTQVGEALGKADPN